LIWDNLIIHDDEDYVSGNTNKIGRVVWQKRNQEWSAKMTDEEKQERLENVVKLISKPKQLRRQRNMLNLSQNIGENMWTKKQKYANMNERRLD
jgi:putative ubiquitin-RnfH superfamily antitoxin RatB of RatAB toxin-antitoxin module